MFSANFGIDINALQTISVIYSSLEADGSRCQHNISIFYFFKRQAFNFNSGLNTMVTLGTYRWIKTTNIEPTAV